MIVLKSAREIAAMRAAGRLVAETLAFLGSRIAPGITTGELDRLAAAFIRRGGGIPAFKGYRGFPAHICTSVNNEVVHGIPGRRELVGGDIVSIDIGVLKDGWYADSAWTFPVGTISAEAARLLAVTEQSLWAGIAALKEGRRLSDVSHAVQRFVEERGYSVVREFVGHGIGRQMHEEPQVPNFGPPGKGPRLQPGLVIALEPMVNEGTAAVRVCADGWTVVTADGRLSAHFEHTVALTEEGVEILTSQEGNGGRLGCSLFPGSW